MLKLKRKNQSVVLKTGNIRKTRKDNNFPVIMRPTRTKIELYGLEELVLQKYITDSLSTKDIAKLCNSELLSREDGVIYNEVNKSNILSYLRRVKDKIAAYEGEEFREIINNAGIIDKIKHLSGLIEEAWKRELIIKEDMIDAFETNDKDRFYQSVSALQSNESLINQVVKNLATIENKLTTCVTIEFVKSLALRLTNVVAESDLLQAEQKERIIVEMSDHIRFGD